MNNGVARLFVQALSVQAEVEAMKASNLHATSPEVVPYKGDDFNELENRLHEISREMGYAANYKD